LAPYVEREARTGYFYVPSDVLFTVLCENSGRAKPAIALGTSAYCKDWYKGFGYMSWKLSKIYFGLVVF
jgi:hypothetical protein